MQYWDTSALVKLYAPEPDSNDYLQLATRARGPILCSSIGAIELLCTLLRKQAAGDLRPGGARAAFRRFHADCEGARIDLLPFGADVAQEAERLAYLAFEHPPRVMIRSLDLVHVASASLAGATTLVAADQRLRALGSRLRMRLAP